MLLNFNALLAKMPKRVSKAIRADLRDTMRDRAAEADKNLVARTVNRCSITITGGRPAPDPNLPSHLFPGCGNDHAKFKVTGGVYPSADEMKALLEAHFDDIANIDYDESEGEGWFVIIDGETPAVGTVINLE